MSFSRTVTINLTDKDGIVECLKKIGVDRAHFTNGTYTMPVDKMMPTTLAGFQCVSDNFSKPTDAFVIAINSDISMSRIMDAKNASVEERAAVESQLMRAHKVAGPLQAQHPDREIVVMFYDEDTPTALYDHLAENGFDMVTLHKHGYGTEPNAPRIEGAHNFSKVLAFPLPHDEKPVCYELTQRGNQTGTVTVVKLTEEVGPHGAPYISKSGEVLFPLNHDSLKKYGPKAPGGSPAGGSPAPQM